MVSARVQPVLLIGANKLEGSTVKLAKPFLIMDKRRRAGATEDAMDVEGTHGRSGVLAVSGRRASCVPCCLVAGGSLESAAKEEEETEYQVVGMIKQKLVFNQRPKPIVSKRFLPPSR